VTSEPGGTFLDRMIALVEGARRQKTPNEIALTLLLAGTTAVFVLAVGTCRRLPGTANGRRDRRASLLSLPVLVALLVCLIPTTIGGLL
jgi:K+-transporting ATPase ATPase B chain